MLYFAYGSNLNHHQMINIRCVGSKFIKNFFLKNYKLIFCHTNKSNKFGYANIIKKKKNMKHPEQFGKLQKSMKKY